jgi:hypothetical protein
VERKGQGSMTDRSRPDEERERPSREGDEKRREERDRRSEDLQEAWRRNHPSGDSEASGKVRPKRRYPRRYPD